jgi:hypothetical protein
VPGSAIKDGNNVKQIDDFLDVQKVNEPFSFSQLDKVINESLCIQFFKEMRKVATHLHSSDVKTLVTFIFNNYISRLVNNPRTDFIAKMTIEGRRVVFDDNFGFNACFNLTNGIQEKPVRY